jgi:hypothetical protein
MDSIGSAIGAAYLYNGAAARGDMKINPEATYILRMFGVQEPPPIEQLPADQKVGFRCSTACHGLMK